MCPHDDSCLVSPMIRDYHVNKDIWTFNEQEQLVGQQEENNIHDLFSVAVFKKLIMFQETTCSLFLQCS